MIQYVLQMNFVIREKIISMTLCIITGLFGGFTSFFFLPLLVFSFLQLQYVYYCLHMYALCVWMFCDSAPSFCSAERFALLNSYPLLFMKTWNNVLPITFSVLKCFHVVQWTSTVGLSIQGKVFLLNQNVCMLVQMS